MVETTPPPRQLAHAWNWRLPLLLLLAFTALALNPRVLHNSALLVAFLGAGVAAGAALLAVMLDARHRGRPLTMELTVRGQHGLQLLAQGTVYAYWALHWPPVASQVPLIAAQVVFAYVVDLAVSWRRFGSFRLGFAPVPIVFSTNLFLWFRDELFIFQFFIIALACVSREFVTWKRDGVRRHIFNPSSFGLAVASVVLLLGGYSHLTWAGAIAQTQGRGPWCYLSIFLAGLVVQTRFPVVLGTLSAVVTTLVMDAAYTALTGGHYYVDTALPIAVYLGMTLLVTDPATSPRNPGGRVLFGTLYAISVFVLFKALDGIGTGGDTGANLTYFDKLLSVPVLNLLVTPIERLGRVLDPLFSAPSNATLRNRLHVLVWALVFFLAHDTRFADHPGKVKLRARVQAGLVAEPCTREEFACTSDAETCRANLPEPGRKRFDAMLRCLTSSYEKDPWAECLPYVFGCSANGTLAE